MATDFERLNVLVNGLLIDYVSKQQAQEVM